MSIKVLVISNYREYHSTRPEANIFLGLAQKGFDIHIMTYGDSGHVQTFKDAGIHVIDFHPEKKFDKKEIQKIRDFVIEHDIDIMQLYNSPAIINGIQAAKNLDVKVVLYRGYSANIHWYDPTNYIKYLHPRVDKIVCNSIGVEGLFHRQLFFKKDKAVTINKGHKLEWYKGYEPIDVRQELGLEKEAFLLIAVGNNRRMKGIPYLLKAMNQLPDELPIHLLLVGRDMDNKANMAILEKGNKKDKVHLLGFREDVLNLVAGCDVFVLPSIFGESITKSVIEAMSLGIAPIISDIAGNRELVKNEESGLVFTSKNSQELYNAIRKLYNDQEYCKQLGKNAQQRIAEHLNAEGTILKMKALYEELMDT